MVFKLLNISVPGLCKSHWNCYYSVTPPSLPPSLPILSVFLYRFSQIRSSQAEAAAVNVDYYLCFLLGFFPANKFCPPPPKKMGERGVFLLVGFSPGGAPPKSIFVLLLMSSSSVDVTCVAAQLAFINKIIGGYACA